MPLLLNDIRDALPSIRRTRAFLRADTTYQSFPDGALNLSCGLYNLNKEDFDSIGQLARANIMPDTDPRLVLSIYVIRIEYLSFIYCTVVSNSQV